MLHRARIAKASARLMLLLVTLPPLAPAEEECRLSADPATVTAAVGSSALLSFRITAQGQDPGHGACEVARAAWFKTRGDERLASYDASTTAVWLLSDSAKVRYGARVELSPGFVIGSGGGGSVWLRLLELRMEDSGILSCHIESSKDHIEATVGLSALFNVSISAPQGCEVTRAAWFRSGRDDRMAIYDASTQRWTQSEVSFQYRGRVELSPGNALGSGGDGTAWLRLRELRMEDNGIYKVKVAWRHDTKQWTDSESVYLTVLNPCHVNFSKSRAVVGGSLTFTLTEPPAGCRLLNFSLQHPRKVDRARAEPVRVLTWDLNSGLRTEAAYEGRVAVVTESKATLQSVELKGLTREDAEEFVTSLWWEYQGRVFKVSWTEHVKIDELAVSKPEVSPRDPVVHVGFSLHLRCVVHQGSPPIFYSWLRGDASSGGNLTATGVHTETWTLHDARHGDRVACEVSNTAGGATTTERSDVVNVTLGCHIESSKDHIEATVGLSALFNVSVSAPQGCEVTRAAWFRSGRDDRMAIYDASTQRWTQSEVSFQYRGRVELSPGNALGSGGDGTAWLRLRELRMEDNGIYKVKVAWRHDTKQWTDSESVYLTVLNPCVVNFSTSRAVVGGSLIFTLTKPPAGCRLLNFSLQHPGKVDRARAEPVRVLTWDYNSGLRTEAAYEGRVAVVTESKATLQSVELKGLTREDAEEFVPSLWWEYQGRVFNVSWTEHVKIDELAVSKPEVSPRDPVAHVGVSLHLRCVVHQGSPPIFYSWLRGDASSGENLTATGVHTETWTLHDARHGDRVACEVSNTAGGATTTERSDVVTVTLGGDSSPPHYIYWSPVVIILMLIAIACLIIYHHLKGRRQEATPDDSPASPPPPPEDEVVQYEALGQREGVYDCLDPSQVQTTNSSSRTRPRRGQGATRHHHPRGGRQASDQYENLPPEHEYEALGHREILYDSLEPSRVQGHGKRGRKEPGHPSRLTSDVSKM